MVKQFWWMQICEFFIIGGATVRNSLILRDFLSIEMTTTSHK